MAESHFRGTMSLRLAVSCVTSALPYFERCQKYRIFMKQQKTPYVILGLLAIAPMTGYDMKKLIRQSIGHFWSESNGQLYPTLNALMKNRFVIISKSGSENKRVSHLYAITDTGREALQKWLSETANQKSTHRDEELLKLFFGANVSSSLALQLLHERAERMRETLAQFAAIQKSIRQKKQSPHWLYWTICLNNGIASAKAELAWCEDSINLIKESL